MAIQTARPPGPPNVFVSFIVDSGTPGWEDLCVKYVAPIINRIQQTNQKTSRFRFSHVLYSSADSHKSPIIKDTYFARVEDSEPAFTAIRQPLQTAIARTVPGGGSAALEGLVRAIEHLDLLESSEPPSKECAKHIIFVTASPPDESKRPLHNISAQFDNFGWLQCEEWLKQHSIRMTLLITRLPAHPLYLSLNTTINPSGPPPMPEGGPLRVFLSSVLTMPQNPNASTLANTSSPAGVGSSPGTNAASPTASRKRKAPEDAQISPRRPKFPPGTVGTNPPVTGTPPIAATVPVLPASANAIGTTPRPISVNGMRPLPATGHLNKTETPSVPPALNVHTGSGVARPVPPTQPTMPPPVGGVRPPSAAGAAVAPPPAATTAPITAAAPGLTNLQGYIAKFLSDPPASQREALMKLTKLRDDQQQLISKLKQEGKHIEANERSAQHRKLAEMMAMLGQELQKQQGQRLRDQAAAAATAGPAQPPNLVNPPRVNMDNVTPAVQPTVPALPNPTIPTQPNTTTMNIPLSGNTGPLNVASTAQPEQATTGPSWRGIMCIVTNNDKTRVNADLLVSLTPMRASGTEQAALKHWPPRLYVQVARSQTPSDLFIQWLKSHQPEGVFVVRLGVDPNSIPAQSMATNPQLQAAIARFNNLQNSIVNSKLVLKGTINLTTGETNHIILFHMPTPVAAGNNAQIALARFSREPNLMMLPGIVPGAPAAGNSTGPGTLGNPPMARSIGIGVANNPPPNALSVPSAMGSSMGIASGVSGSLTNTGAATGGPASGLTAQQVANMLNNAGAGNLNALQSNPNLAALMSNPQVFSQLQRLRQQQQLGSGVGNSSNMGMPGMGSAPNHGMGGAGLSGANLLDRLGTSSLGHSSSISGPSTGSNTFGTVPGGSSLQQQQVMAALSAHSATMGGAAANLGNNNMFGTTFPNFGINNPQPNSVGTMGNMNFNSNQSQLGLNMGLNSGGIGAGMGASMGTSNNFGMANAVGTAGRGLTPAHLNEIRRRASVMAANTGISEQEALARVFRGLTGGSG